MRKNNIIVLVAAIIVIDVFVIIFMVNNSKLNNNVVNNTIIPLVPIDTVEINSNKIKNLLKSYIKYKDNRLFVIIEGVVKYEYTSNDSCFIDYVNYDRIKGFISLNECKLISKNEDGFREWTYISKVIDYKNQIVYNFGNGESNDGESFYSPEIINFNPHDSSRIVLHHGYESFNTTFYFNNKEKDLSFTNSDVEGDWAEILAQIDSINYLVSITENSVTKYIIYNAITDQITSIQENTLLNYNSLMLKQFGIKYYYVNGEIRRMRDLNSSGTARYNYFVDNCVYDLNNNTKYYLKTDYKIIPIW